MACPNCGSWSVKADRSLSGRMVCGRCGEPLGIGRRGPGRPAVRRGGLRRSGRWRLWLGLTALVALSAVLAGLAERWPTDRWPATPKRLTLRASSATPMQQNMARPLGSSHLPEPKYVGIRSQR